MFSTRPGSHKGAAAFGQLYRNVSLETGLVDATPHRLVAMLFEGLCEAIVHAMSAMERNDPAEKGLAIGRAVRIIDEGLRPGLNLTEGGALAQDLRDLYAYMTLRLTQANLRNDSDALGECLRLVGTLREAWAAIAPAAALRPDA